MVHRIRRSSKFVRPLVLAAVMAFAVQVAAQAQTKSWHYRDLTAATGAPRPAGQLAGFHVGDRDDPRVYYSDNNGRVWELAYYQASLDFHAPPLST